METKKPLEMSASEWKLENRKAESAIYLYIKKLPCESAQEEFHHRCQCKFQELIQTKFPYPYSFYNECFRRIFVDILRKSSLYLHTYSKPSSFPAFLNEPSSYVDPTPGVSKTEILTEAISLLPPDEQFLIFLMDYCKMTSTRVASILGKDQSTYHRQHKRILKKMKTGIVKKWGEAICSI